MVSSLAYFVTLLQKDFVNYCNRRLSEINLSQGQLYFILYVGKHPGGSPKELSHALHMDAGHTARSLTRLEHGGFLMQEPDPEDRRAHILRLTEAGEAAFRLSHELFSQWDEAVLGSFTEEEQSQLIVLLERVVHTVGGEFGVRKNS